MMKGLGLTQDINIFISTLQNAIDELKNLDDIEPTIKAGILNRALPENLRFINVFQYKNDWEKLCEYVKNVLPDIVFSNMKESMKLEVELKPIFLTAKPPKPDSPRKFQNKPRIYRN